MPLQTVVPLSSNMKVCIVLFVALYAFVRTGNADPVDLKLPVEISSKIPWLQDSLRSDGSLAFRYGRYFLGLNETSPVNQRCTRPYTEKEGLCKLVKDCEVLYPELKDSNDFRRHACDIHTEHLYLLAGLCCPTT